MRLTLLFLSFLAMFALSACQADQPVYFAHDKSDLTADSKIEYGRLSNGLRYAVMANETPTNTASLLMRIDTGSLNEQDDELGLAHFLEHMAFNGSRNIPEGEMIKRLERFGLAFGADTNASTDFEETIYRLELPEVNDDILDETLMIMRETAQNLTLDADAIERERGIILAEKRARISPSYRAFIDTLEFYLGDTPFPNRIPIGTEDTINAVTAEQFRNFYAGFYRPENTFIVLVGDFETGYAAEKISSFFGDWQPEGMVREAREINTVSPRPARARYYVDPEIQTSITLSAMSEADVRPDNKTNRRAFFVEGLGNRILSRRLSKMARSGEADFINGSASSSNVFDVVGLSSLALSTQPEKWEKALVQGEQALRQALEYGFTQAELDEQIANSRNALQVAVQTSPTRRTPGLAQRIMSSFGNDNVLTDPADNLERFSQYADDITVDEVYAAFKMKWAGLDEPQIYLSTSRIIDNAEETIMAVYAASRAQDVTPLENSQAAKFAYTDFGPAGAVKSRETVEDIEFEQIIFDNNVRLNIKKTPYEKDAINISIAFGAGDLFFPAEAPGFKWFAPNMLNLGGLEAHSVDDIQTIMAGKTVGSSFSFGARRLYLSGSTVPENLEDQLNLMTAYITAPGYRETARKRYDDYIQSFYPTLDSTPGGVAARDVDRLIRSGDPRFGIPGEDDLVGIELATLKNWMAPYLENSAIEIGIVGDVDPDDIIKAVARTLGALPEREPLPPAIDPAATQLTFPDGSPRPVKLSHAGEPETAMLRVFWPAPDGRVVDITRRISLISEMFKLRLTEVLREEEGATYSPSAYAFNPRFYPDYGYVAVSLELAPDQLDAVSAKVDQIAAEIRTGQFDQALFERAIKPIQEQVETSLESNGYWMGVVHESQTDIERLDRHRSRSAAYDTMRLEELQELAKTLFDPQSAYRVHILPEQ